MLVWMFAGFLSGTFIPPALHSSLFLLIEQYAYSDIKFINETSLKGECIHYNFIKKKQTAQLSFTTQCCIASANRHFALLSQGLIVLCEQKPPRGLVVIWVM